MSQIEKLLDVARAELGVTEYPPESNNVKYNTEYYGQEVYGSKYAWCCAFVRWCFVHAGLFETLWRTPIEHEGVTTVYCPYVEGSAKYAGQWVTSGYKPGDVVLFGWGNNMAQHIGIVETANGDNAIVTIEGNTSSTSNDNGGAVKRQNRRASEIRGAYRPNYIEEEEDVPRFNKLADMPDWAKETVKKLIEKKIISVNGTADEANALNLSEDMLRLLVFNDRAGIYK